MEKEQELPSGWTVAKLKDIADWSSGGTPKATVPEYYGGDIPWLIIGDLNDGYVYKSASSLTTLGLKESSAKMVKPYSVLVAMYGSIGKLGINRIPVATNQAIAFTEKLYEIVTNRYLFFYLLFVRPQLLGLGQGGTQKNISQTILKEVFISLPPLPEQHRIIAKIEELFSELDKGVESLKTAQEQLKIYRQAVLQRAFEGICGNNDIENSIRNISIFVTSGSRGWAQYYSETGARFIRIGNLTRDTIFLELSDVQRLSLPTNAEGVRSRLKPEDILISITADIGSVAVVPADIGEAYINQHIAVVRLHETGYSKYVAYYLKSEDGRRKLLKHERGATKKGIGLDDIRDISLPIPNKTVVDDVVAEIESRLSVCDKLEESISQSLLQAEALRQSILKKAFEGKLVPQDPQDEPAEKLLARIRAERAQTQPAQKVAKGRKKK